MIPILYETNENAFATNGLGRLHDCVSCTVTEERNGVYECDFEYPIAGAKYEQIQLGRIIGVTHDDTGDVQPFDIVSFSRPIDGVVKFHAVHISYRQSYLTVAGSSINSLADAFTLLGTAQPSNPFTYTSDITSTAYLAAADGTPRTVRSMLGGVEGSILDAYGGEYEWDKFNVILHSARGQLRDFTIRYGVNMLDYNEDCDASGTYSNVIPYYKGGDSIVVGDMQSSGSTITGRGECIPLDVSDKFEDTPTKAQVEAMGLSIIQDSTANLPTQTINVSFVRLQDMSEFEGLSNLLNCKLCDSIKVIFPYYQTSGNFKIVKTTWDVLQGRFESMELGSLSVTLSEALGISNTLGENSGNNATDETDFIIVTNTSQQTLSQQNTVVKWNVNNIAKQVGTRLSFDSNDHSVKIGAGVKYIAIQGTIYIYTAGTSGLKNVYVYKNDDEVARTVTDIRYNYQSISTPYRIIEVSQGDVITIRVNSQNGTTTVIAGDNSGGSVEGLFVQVIA